MDPIQILYGVSLGISDDLINFWEKIIKNKILKKWETKKFVGAISYAPLVGSHSNFMW